MRDDVNIDFAKFIDRAHQFHFLIVSQIAQIEQADLAKGDDCPQRASIFRLIGRIFVGIFAARILLSSAGQRLADQFAIWADDPDIHAMNRKVVAWFRDHVLELSQRQHSLVRLPDRAGWFVFSFAVDAMVNKRSHRDPSG